MTPKEAYQLLEINENASDDEIKSKYKKLAKQYHPDVYSDKEKFKHINEAYQYILDYRKNPHKYEQKDFDANFQGFGDIFSTIFGRSNNPQQVRHSTPPPELNI